jgi:hypothetical protein
MEKTIALVAEGETDIIVFQALAKHFSNENITYKFIPLAPQKDATSNSFPSHGFGEVLNWCEANKNEIQMHLDFKGMSALFIQMDTDIANQINDDFKAGFSPRQCCENKLNEKFSLLKEPDRCHYILPTESTETWLLASNIEVTWLSNNLSKITNYELITNTEQRLIEIGYSSRKVKSKRRLNKKPAKKYNKYAQQIIENLDIARQRCPELDRLCHLIIK